MILKKGFMYTVNCAFYRHARGPTKKEARVFGETGVHISEFDCPLTRLPII